MSKLTYGEENKRNIFIILTSSNAYIPSKSDEYSAGWKLYTPRNGSVNSKERQCISLGLSVALTRSIWVRIIPTYSLASKKGIAVAQSLIKIKSGNELSVTLYNTSNTIYRYSKGDCVAHLIPNSMNYCSIRYFNRNSIYLIPDGSI